jgi:hypothetical protein
MFGYWKDFLKNKDGSWAWDKLVAVFVSLAGLAGGAGTFYYKEIYTPSAVPVNVSMALNIKRLPRQPIHAGPAVIPVQLNAAAKNESNKILKINKTHWVAHARSLRGEMINQSEFIADVNEQMALGEATLNLRDSASSPFQKSLEPWDPVGFDPYLTITKFAPKRKFVLNDLFMFLPMHSFRGRRAQRLIRKIPINYCASR